MFHGRNSTAKMASRLSVPYPSPSPLTSDLRSSLTSALLHTSSIVDLHATLLSSCQSTGWFDAVRERAVQLLRSGECSTYSEVMAIIRAESRGKRGEFSGEKRLRRTRDVSSHGMNDGYGMQKEVDVNIPQSVITEGQALVKLALAPLVKVVRKEEAFSS